VISGYSLAHRKMPYDEGLQGAAEVARGVRRYEPTQAEIAASFKVSASQLSRELKAIERWEAEQGITKHGDELAVAAIVDWRVANGAPLFLFGNTLCAVPFDTPLLFCAMPVSRWIESVRPGNTPRFCSRAAVSSD
jgi:hypothetical protein